jgi:hypothetical protein
MSTVRYFDAPHIVRYGMLSAERGESWIKLWRNGVGFTIEIHQRDIKGTAFERQWFQKVQDQEQYTGSLGNRLVDRWDDLCDLVLSQCLTLLQDLAPNGHEWKTIDDYLHTPSYKIHLFVNEAGDDVVPRVVDGPVDKCSYEFQPAPITEFAVPPDVPSFSARDVIVLDKERDYRRPPYKVRLPDSGPVVFFLPCQVSARMVNTGVVSNRSRKAIDFYLHVHQLQLSRTSSAARIPNLLGIVISDSGGTTRDVAGILLEWLEGETLMDSETHISARDKHAVWKSQLIQTVKALHENGIFSVEISPFYIVIDDQGNDVWLTGFGSYNLSRDNDTGGDGVDADSEFKRMELIFDQWLPEQNTPESSALSVEERRKNRLQRYWALVRGDE